MPKPAADTRHPIFRYLRWIGYTLVVLVVIAAVAPMVIAKTALSTWIISLALGDLPISVKVKSLSLGWWTQIEAEDVEVRDSQGRMLAQVPKLTINRNLASLAMSTKNLGKIRLEKPTIDVTFAKGSSNVEDLIAERAKAVPGLSTPSPTRAASKLNFQVEIADGTVRIVDTDANLNWRLANLEGSLAHENNTPMTGRAKASIAGAAEPGSIDLNLVAQPENTVLATLKNIPVALAGPVLRRSYPDLGCGGTLEGQAVLSYRVTAKGTAVFGVHAQVFGNNLELLGGPIGKDHLLIRKLTTNEVQVQYTGDVLDVLCRKLDCDLGQLDGSGKILLDRPLVASLSEPDASLNVDLNLAACAQQLPRTMKLHKDVTLTFGRVTFEGKSKGDGNGAVWEGKLSTTEFRGSRGNKAIKWPEPIALGFSIKQTATAPFPEVRNLSCKSSFMTLHGSATNSSVLVNGSIDLGRLAEPLGQFVDLGEWPLSGKATAAFEVKEPIIGAFTYDLDAHFDQFQWGPWIEKQLIVKGEVFSKVEGDQRRIEKSSQLRVVGGNDVLEVKVSAPLVLSTQGSTGSLYAVLEGDLAQWQRRLKLFVPGLSDFAVQATAKCEAWVNLLAKKIDLQPVQLTAKELSLTYAGLRIHDPNLIVQVTATYNTEQGLVDLKNSQIKGEALVVHTKELRVDLNRKAMAGTVLFRGEMARLKDWFSPPVTGEAWAGVVTGQADLQSGDDGFEVNLTSTIKDAAFGPTKTPRYRDPAIQLAAKGRYAGRQGMLTFDKVTLQSLLGVADGRVNLAKLDSTMELDVVGSLSYDLAGAQAIVKQYLGAAAQIVGKDRRDFRLVGPLRPKGNAPGATIELAGLQGNAGLKWDSLKGYGADVGPADLKANLHGGWIKVDPVVASLNQGRLKLAPNLRLSPEPQFAEMPAGPVIENAKITPAMCASALGYALPLLANVAQAEGELSMNLTSARVPLADPSQAEVQGVLVLHHAKVGPSPLVAELSSLIKSTTPFSLIRENQVKFKVEKGRVYHENLELLLPDNFTVKTSGSVGFDSSLDMTVEMPIPAKLVGNLKLPAALARTPVKLPISGTVDHPRIDSRALQQVLQQAGRDAAGNLLKDQLNKFLKPKN